MSHHNCMSLLQVCLQFLNWGRRPKISNELFFSGELAYWVEMQLMNFASEGTFKVIHLLNLNPYTMRLLARPHSSFGNPKGPFYDLNFQHNFVTQSPVLWHNFKSVTKWCCCQQRSVNCFRRRLTPLSGPSHELRICELCEFPTDVSQTTKVLRCSPNALNGFPSAEEERGKEPVRESERQGGKKAWRHHNAAEIPAPPTS